MQTIEAQKLMQEYQIIATKHAYKKAKERFSWKPKALNRMMVKAFLVGITRNNTKSILKKFIAKKCFNHKNCNNIRIYGQNIYFFCGRKLITLYRLSNNLIKCL